MNCKRCGLHKTRIKIVEGRGSIPADIVFIGEGPGVSEDLLGKPFIGPSGKLLDQMFKDAGIDSMTYFITNCVLCRPTDIRNGQNREPKTDEVMACRQNVIASIDKTQCRQVVFIGKIAQRYFSGIYPKSIHIHHPSFLLRTGGVKSPYYNENIIKLQKMKGDL